MLAARPREVVNELIEVVLVDVRPLGVVAETVKPGDADARDPPGDRGPERDSGDLQLRNDVALRGQLAPQAVEEVVVAGPELVDHRRGKDSRIAQHRLLDIREQLRPVEVKSGRDRHFVSITVAAEPARAGALDEIDALDELVFVGLPVLRVLVVADQAPGVCVRRRVELQEPLRSRMDPALRNDVAGKRSRAVERVVDREWNLAEVPVAHRSRGDGEKPETGPSLAEPLEVRHEEELVTALEHLRDPDGAAQSEAVLIPLEGLLPWRYRCESVLERVYLVVAVEFEERAVELVCPRLGRDVNLARRPPELGREDAGLHLELLQRVDRRQDHVGVEVHIGVLDPVEREAVEHAPLPGDRDVLGRAGPPLSGPGLTRALKARAHV